MTIFRNNISYSMAENSKKRRRESNVQLVGPFTCDNEECIITGNTIDKSDETGQFVQIGKICYDKEALSRTIDMQMEQGKTVGNRNEKRRIRDPATQLEMTQKDLVDLGFEEWRDRQRRAAEPDEEESDEEESDEEWEDGRLPSAGEESEVPFYRNVRPLTESDRAQQHERFLHDQASDQQHERFLRDLEVRRNAERMARRGDEVGANALRLQQLNPYMSRPPIYERPNYESPNSNEPPPPVQPPAVQGPRIVKGLFDSDDEDTDGGSRYRKRSRRKIQQKLTRRKKQQKRTRRNIQKSNRR